MFDLVGVEVDGFYTHLQLWEIRDSLIVTDTKERTKKIGQKRKNREKSEDINESGTGRGGGARWGLKKTGSGLRFQPPHINAQNVTPVGLNTAKIVYAFVMKVLFAKSLETSSLSQISAEIIQAFGLLRNF